MFSISKTFTLVFTALSFAAMNMAAPVEGELEARQYVTGGTGDATWYNPAGAYTACGTLQSDGDMIVAVSHLLYNAYPGATPNPNLNPICGKKIQATYNGRTITVTVADKCMGCALTDLDFTPTGFSQLADTSIGRLHGMTWKFV